MVQLSPREAEVINLLSRGHRFKEIAGRLGISATTVRTHLERSYEKLQVSSRTEAVAKFIRLG